MLLDFLWDANNVKEPSRSVEGCGGAGQSGAGVGVGVGVGVESVGVFDAILIPSVTTVGRRLAAADQIPSPINLAAARIGVTTLRRYDVATGCGV